MTSTLRVSPAISHTLEFREKFIGLSKTDPEQSRAFGAEPPNDLILLRGAHGEITLDDGWTLVEAKQVPHSF